MSCSDVRLVHKTKQNPMLDISFPKSQRNRGVEKLKEKVAREQNVAFENVVGVWQKWRKWGFSFPRSVEGHPKRTHRFPNVGGPGLGAPCWFPFAWVLPMPLSSDTKVASREEAASPFSPDVIFSKNI